MTKDKKDSVFKMIGALSIICLFSGLCLSYTYTKTRQAIASAELEAQLKSVREVLPEFDGEPEAKTLIIDGEERTFYIAKKAGLLYGLDLIGSAMGAWITSAFLIPLLGIYQTLSLLAVFNACSLALLMASKKNHEKPK